MEIEVVPGNIVTNESVKDVKTDSKTSNQDEAFQKLKEKLHTASQKYNTDSTMTVRFLQPLRIRFSSDCSRSSSLSTQSSQVW